VLVRARWRRWTAAGVAGGVAAWPRDRARRLAFDLAWGYNYDRAPVAALLRYDLAPAPAERPGRPGRRAPRAGGRATRGLPEDGAGALRLTDGRRGRDRRGRRGYAAPAARFTVCPCRDLSAPPKLVLLSPLMSYLGIGGIFIPYHLRGERERHPPRLGDPVHVRARAGRTSAASRARRRRTTWGTCLPRASGSDFQYSGTFRAALYALGALAQVDRPSYAGCAAP
jgi:hypothetical protein